jgi:rod shape-determining protein MreC
MVLDEREHYLLPVKIALDTLVAPLQYAVDAPAQWSKTLNTNLVSRQALLAENATLRANQLLLQAKLEKLIALENENRQLRALLLSTPHLGSSRIAVAQLLDVNTDPLVSEVIIDKGFKSGVYEGQPVLDAYGIMGQVVQVGPLTSRVLLITDLRSAVPVQDARSGIRGIVTGQGKLAKLALIDIPDTADVHAGDTLVSSGLGGHYPEGYPVGIVIAVRRAIGQSFMHVDAVPSAQLDKSQNLLLIWPEHSPTIDLPKSSKSKQVSGAKA